MSVESLLIAQRLSLETVMSLKLNSERGGGAVECPVSPYFSGTVTITRFMLIVIEPETCKGPFDIYLSGLSTENLTEINKN